MGFPWREYKRFCLGVLRWPPSEFWKASVWDVAEAYEGYPLANGIKTNPKSALTGDDVTELRRMIDTHG